MNHHHHLQLISEATPLLSDEGYERVHAAMHSGLDSVQIRERTASASTILAAARRLLPCASERGVVVTINDRADIAMTLLPTRRSTPGGSLVPVGVHLGSHSLPVLLVRRHLPLPLVGVSVHEREEAVAAARDGADYLTFGHIYSTASHPGEHPVGLARLQDVANAVDIPVFAIGGIDVTNVADVLASGATGIVVISAILNAPDPAAATAELRAALDHDARYRIGP